MKSSRLRSSLVRLTIAVGVGVVAAAGCGGQKVAGSPSGAGEVPKTPAVMAGQAQVSGLVRDGDGNAVVGATVRVAESESAATSDATGAYQLSVPADSTLTLVTTAAGFATTYRESIMLAEGVMASGFDVMLLPVAEVTRVNGMVPNVPADMRGLVAVRLHSLKATCVTAGARVSVWPPLAATVVYGRPSDTGGLDEVDTALSGVEAGARVDAWLAGAVPPGNMFEVRVDRPGCGAAQAPSQGGLLLTGQRRVDAQALTQIELFLE
jgi:hypothetical protein